MKPLTLKIPKPLLKIKDKTILDHIFDSLPKKIDRVILVVGYLKEKIQKHVGNFYKGRPVDYVVQENLGGTADAINLCRSFFKDGERFMVLYGDDLQFRDELEKCLSYKYSWLCFPVPKPESSGIADIRVDGTISEVVEKPKNPKSNLAAAGAIVLDTEIFDYAPESHPNGERYLSSAINQFLKDHQVFAVIGRERPSLTSSSDLNNSYTT